MKSFIIIGMGLSGNATFCQLVNHLIAENSTSLEEITITVIEKNQAYFATGAPYQIDSPAIWTLNNTANEFKFLPEVESLTTWMQNNKSQWEIKFPLIDKEYYVPRALAGMYLKAQYEAHKNKAQTHDIKVIEYFVEISDIFNGKDNIWTVFTSDSQFQSDYLFLCFGHAPNYQFSHLWSKPNFFSSTASIPAFEKIPVEADVYILGGQSTFVDIALWFAYVHQHKGEIHTVTRNSPIITTKGNSDTCTTETLDTLQQYLQKKTPNSLSFNKGKTLFWQAYKEAAKEPINCDKPPSIVNALDYQVAKKYEQTPRYNSPGNIDELRAFIKYFYFNGCYKEFWEKLEDSEKTLFTKFMYSQIMAYLTGITPVNARLLLELYERNMIIEHVGLREVTYDESKKKFILSFQSGKTIEVEYLIDASGLSYDISQCHTDFPLLKNMVAKGYIVPKKHGGILRNANNQTINNEGKVQSNLFCIGPVASYSYHYPTPYASFLVFNEVNQTLQGLKTN
jgi:uncharacterized NAD(P)/FAD-binding protein YdhS